MIAIMMASLITKIIAPIRAIASNWMQMKME
jgi:hypothetical protein